VNGLHGIRYCSLPTPSEIEPFPGSLTIFFVLLSDVFNITNVDIQRRSRFAHVRSAHSPFTFVHLTFPSVSIHFSFSPLLPRTLCARMTFPYLISFAIHFCPSRPHIYTRVYLVLRVSAPFRLVGR